MASATVPGLPNIRRLYENEDSLLCRKDIGTINFTSRLTHFEELLYDHLWSGWRALQFNTLDKKTGLTDFMVDEFYRRHRVEAFLHIAMGFFIGYTDLSGRHEARWNFILPLLNSFLLDVYKISAAPHPMGHIMWQDMKTKWMISYDIKFKSVLDWYDRFLPFFASRSRPKFQRQLLVHLPEEILRTICQYVGFTEDMRSFARTCRLLRRTSLPYLYHTCIFSLSRSTLGGISGRVGSEPPLQELATAVERFASLFFSFIQHREVLAQVIRVHVRSAWDTTFVNGLRSDRDEDTANFLLHRFHTVITALIPLCTRVRSMTLTNIRLDAKLYAAICAPTELHTLELRYCTFPYPVPYQFPFGRAFLKVRTLVVAVRIFPGRFLSCLLYALPMCCPFAEDISILQIHTLVRPPIAFVTPHMFNYIFRPRRLHLTGLIPSLIGPLVDRLSDVRYYKRTITHCKLVFPVSISFTEFCRLLSGLQSSPVSHLAVIGLRDGSPGLFDALAIFLPRLESLLLLYHGTCCRKLTMVWPEAPWVYAARAALLTCLRAFGWNYRLPPSDTFVSPHSAILKDQHDRFEDAFMSEYLDDVVYDNPKYFMADVFRAYNPSLDTVAVYTTEMHCLRSWDLKQRGDSVDSVGSGRNLVWNPCHKDIDRFAYENFTA